MMQPRAVVITGKYAVQASPREKRNTDSPVSRKKRMLVVVSEVMMVVKKEMIFAHA